MFNKIIDALLDKMLTQDFWRGIMYALAGAGIAIDPNNAATITSVALLISGVLHSIWNKQSGEKIEKK